MTFGSDQNASYKYYKLSYGQTGSANQERLGWYWGAENGAAFQMNGGKAWLVLPASAAVRSFGIDGESTDISIMRSHKPSSDCYYDLQGRKVSSSQLPPGIYIINNKKVIIK